MANIDISKVRDSIADYCFNECEHMKNSDRYMTCSLSKKKDYTCKVWDFLKYLAKKEEKEWTD